MRGLRLGMGLSRSGGVVFTPASLFSPLVAGAWYDPSDLTTMYQTGTRGAPGAAVAADGDPVGLILDKSGNQFDMVQGTAVNRPLYKTAGGLHWLEFDGSNDYLECLSFTATQPWDRISTIRQIAWVGGDWIYAGRTESSAILAQGDPGVSPSIGIYSGLGPLSTSDATLSTERLVEERHNGASSRVRVDAGSFVSGNAGATNIASGMYIAARTGVPSTAANIRMYQFVQRNGVLTAGELVSTRTYVGAKAGLIL